MHKQIVFFFLIVSWYISFSQNIAYKTTTVDSIIIENKNLNSPGKFYYTLVGNSNSFYLYFRSFPEFIYQYDISGKLKEKIKIYDEKPSKSPTKYRPTGIALDNLSLHLLAFNAKIYYQYDFDQKKIIKKIKTSKKYEKTKLQLSTFHSLFDIFKNFTYDTALKKFVVPIGTDIMYSGILRQKPEKVNDPHALASIAVFNEKGKVEHLLPYLGAPYSFNYKFFPSNLYLHKAYNPKTKVYYYTSRYNNDIVAVNLKDYSHFSFGHKVDTVKFIPPEDTSLALLDSFLLEVNNQYLKAKIQQNMFAGIRYDSHYNLLFQTYIVTNPEYRKKHLEILSKIPSWKTCGTVVPPVKWEGKIRHYFTQVYTPEGKYLGTVKDHERYTPLRDDVLYQEGNTYWVRGPIKNGKWTIYKMKMALEVESLEK